MSWTDKFKNAFHGVKDTGASAAIRAWLTRELADYGEVQGFRINSRERQAEIHILLKGETTALTVVIEGYELSSASGVDFVTATSARASREWVNAVLRNFIIGRRFPIPAQYAGLAKLVLTGAQT